MVIKIQQINFSLSLEPFFWVYFVFFLILAVKLAVEVKFVAERFTSDLNDPDSSLFKNLTAKIEREVWRNSVINFKSKKKVLSSNAIS